ncbi:unnamed protein product [Rhizophagus irregularis]|nr:unnamed protein product [Rhizophagus irregularis]
MDGFKARRQELEDIVGHVSKHREKSSKNSKKDKKKKKSKKSQRHSVNFSDDDDESDDYLSKIDKMSKDADTEIEYSSDDRDPYINRPIATASGSNMEVDHSDTICTTSKSVAQSDIVKPQSQSSGW